MHNPQNRIRTLGSIHFLRNRIHYQAHGKRVKEEIETTKVCRGAYIPLPRDQWMILYYVVYNKPAMYVISSALCYYVTCYCIF